MAVLYPIVAPVGNAIGIAIRTSFNSNSHNTIIVQGIMGSLSYAKSFVSSEINYRYISCIIVGSYFFQSRYYVLQYIHRVDGDRGMLRDTNRVQLSSIGL